MEPLVGLAGIAVMLFLLALGVPIAFAMGFTGFAGFAFLWGMGPAVTLTIITAYTKLNSFILVCIPLFMFMGQTLFYSGTAGDLFTALHRWLSRLPGGLAMAVTATSAGFAAVCGSSPAVVATMGSVALPEMRKHNYSPRLATGCIAAAGTLGILIPPSIPMVLYGILTEQSIGRLFIAGIVPGLISASLYMVMIYLRAKHNPALAPAGPSTSRKEKLSSIRKVWVIGTVFIIVIGGIYLGIFTPTEASAVGAFIVLLLGLVQRKLTKGSILSSMEQTAHTTGMILAIITAAMVFSTFLVTTGLTSALANFVISLNADRYVILLAILLIYLVLGTCLCVISIIVITIPLFFPIVMGLGFDPIWFGVLVTKMIEVALITPPIGFNCLILKSVSGDYATVGDIFAGIGWFFVMDIITIVILVAFPQISLFLPNLMFQ